MLVKNTEALTLGGVEIPIEIMIYTHEINGRKTELRIDLPSPENEMNWTVRYISTKNELPDVNVWLVKSKDREMARMFLNDLEYHLAGLRG